MRGYLIIGAAVLLVLLYDNLTEIERHNEIIRALSRLQKTTESPIIEYKKAQEYKNVIDAVGDK